jgi:hypothetical protein
MKLFDYSSLGGADYDCFILGELMKLELVFVDFDKSVIDYYLFVDYVIACALF